MSASISTATFVPALNVSTAVSIVRLVEAALIKAYRDHTGLGSDFESSRRNHHALCRTWILFTGETLNHVCTAVRAYSLNGDFRQARNNGAEPVSRTRDAFLSRSAAGAPVPVRAWK